MDNKIINIGIFLLLIITTIIGDIFLKYAGSGKNFINYTYFTLGFLLYGISAFGWFYLLKFEKISILAVFYSVTTILTLALVGVFYFKENINMYETAGIIMAISSIILLSKFS